MSENSWIDEGASKPSSWVEWPGYELPTEEGEERDRLYAFAPVPRDCLVEIQARDGGTGTKFAGDWGWWHDGADNDIVRYRILESVFDGRPIEHITNKLPVPGEMRIKIILRDGTEITSDVAQHFRWKNLNHSDDIMSYILLEPEHE